MEKRKRKKKKEKKGDSPATVRVCRLPGDCFQIEREELEPAAIIYYARHI